MAANKFDWEMRATRPAVEATSGVRKNVQDGLSAVGASDPLPLDGMRVVWVDPDRETAAHGRAVLESWGALVLYADGAASGLDTAVQAKPHCVVINVPQGIQVARTLYYMIPNAPPVVLISELAPSADADAFPGVTAILLPAYRGRDMLYAMLGVRGR